MLCDYSDDDFYSIEGETFIVNEDCSKLFNRKTAGLSMHNLPKWKNWGKHQLNEKEEEIIKFLISRINDWSDDKNINYKYDDLIMVERYPDENCELSLILTFTNKNREWCKDVYTFDINKSEFGYEFECVCALIEELNSDYED